MLGFLSMMVTPMPLAMQHLRDGLAEAAIADDDGAGRRRILGAVEAVAAALFTRLRASRSMRIRNGVVAIDRVTTAPNNDAASGMINCAAVAWANRTKPNSPAWLSSRPRRRLRAQLLPNASARPAISNDLDGDHRHRNADHEQGLRGDQAQVEQHPDRQEEQAEQDRAERLDVAFKLVPVGRFGEHHAGDEGAQRDRQMQQVHDRGRSDDREQAGDDEQFALAQPADQAEQRVEHQPADERPAPITASTV